MDMVAVRRLGNPPIAEAVVNFGWRLPRPLPEGFHEGLSEAFKAKYPKAQKLQLNSFQLSFEPASPGEAAQPKTSGGSAFSGYRFESHDGGKVAIVNGENFLVSHVRGYTTWEDLVGDAREAWEVLSPVAQPLAVHRLGLRYINRLALPLPANSDDYLPGGPVLPPELELGITGFLSQVAIDLPIHAQATVLQTIQHDVDGKAYAIIDVDVFRDGLSLQPGDEEVWQRLTAFREWKNRIFFAHVTDKLLEPYQ